MGDSGGMTQSNNGRRHLPVRDLLAGLREAGDNALGAIFRDLGAPGDGGLAQHIRALQLRHTVRAIPLLIAFHLAAALAFITFLAPPGAASMFWLAAAFQPVALFGLVLFLAHHGKQPRHGLQAIEAAALALGLVWAAVPAFILPHIEGMRALEVLALALTVGSIGAITLSRVPTAAVLFVTLMSAAFAAGMARHGGETSLVTAPLCLVQGLVLTGLVLSFHAGFLRHARTAFDVAHQQDVIALLLHDFEDGSADWLWETDATGALTYVSPRLCELLGRPAGEILGKSFAGLFELDTSHAGWTAFGEDMMAQRPIEARIIEVPHPRGNRHWEMNARPLRSERNAFLGYRGVSRDISHRWQAEHDLREAKDQAEAASAAKSRFMAVMSHELRTPINAIVGFSELLSSEQADGLPHATRAEYLATILDSTRHLQSLINDILEATRIEKGGVQLVDQDGDAAELIEVAARLCRDQASAAGVTCVVRTADGIGIRGDLARLKQIVVNLLSNAIKFSPRGGIVNVTMQRDAGGRLLILLRDAGIGIAPQDIERIFEPFTQADDGQTRGFGGIGLGLPIARQIARLHGGDVTLESQPGAGTVARLVLPAARVHWPGQTARPGSGVAA